MVDHRSCGCVSRLSHGAGASGNVAPIRLIAGSSTDLYRCSATALDRKGDVYVTDGELGVYFLTIAPIY
ncbi:MAG: hypothetical protein WA431_11740 [Candidatus Cybelea sp.]